jgi:hypothetical protein
MKKFTITLVLAFLVFKSHAQTWQSPVKEYSFELSNNTTRSIYGWKSGPQFTFNLNNRWQVNYAYLLDLSSTETDAGSFHGGQFKYYFNPKSKLNVGLGLRVGVYNDQFIAVIPSLDVKVHATDQINISMGLARLDRYPYFDLSFGFKVFKKKFLNRKRKRLQSF